MKCDVCLQNWKWSELRSVQIWSSVIPHKKRELIEYGDGSTRLEYWEIDDCEKSFIVCFNCLKDLNFRRYRDDVK